MTGRPDHLLIAFSYDGTRFRGVWPQPDQPTASAALLDRLEQAMHRRPTAFAVAARTDAGVSAAINLATVRLWHGVDLTGLAGAAQDRDDGLGSVRTWRVPLSVHARTLSRRKRYAYRFEERTLDLDAMAQAAAHLVGEYDVGALRGRGVRREACHDRRVDRVEVVPGPDGPTLLVEGRRFVRYQVRMMAALLLRYGRRQAPPDQIRHVLDSGDPRQAEWPAAPEPLTLTGLEIPDPEGPVDHRWVSHPDEVNLGAWLSS